MGGRPAVCTLWLLAGLCIGPGSLLKSGVTPGLRHGLLFQPRGHLILATGAWTAVIRFRQEDTKRQADTIRQQFQQIENALPKIGQGDTNDNEINEGRRLKQFSEELNRIWKHEKLWMEAELRVAETEIRELQAELKRSRQRRGLINALGDGLKWLFGTATEKDTKQLHEQIKRTEAGIGKLHHIAELQTTLVGSITKEQKTNARNIALLAKKAADLEIALTETKKTSVFGLRNIRHELDTTQVISSAIRTASAAVMAFHGEVRKISRAMEHTQQGRVTPAIISPQKLKTTLNAITKHLPEGWTPAIPPSDAPAHIYEFLELAAIALEDGWEVHVKIPLQYRPYSHYQLYQVTAVPTHFSNSSLALKTEVTSRYFAISKDQRLHLEVGTEEIARCRQAGGRTVCHEWTPLIREKREGCLYHAFRDDRDKASKHCKKVVTKPTPQVYALTDRNWLYVLPTEETFSMQCSEGSETRRGFRLQGTGVFSLPPGCAAIGDDYIVPAHLRRQTYQPEEMRLEDFTRFKIDGQMPEINLQIPSEDGLNQTGLEEIVRQAEEKDSKSPTLAQLQGLVQQWNTSQETVEVSPLNLVNHTSLSLGTVGVLGVIGLIVYGCCRKREPPPSANLSYRPPPYAPETLETTRLDLSHLLSRLTHLEAEIYQLKKNMDTLSSQDATIEALRKKYEDLACLL